MNQILAVVVFVLSIDAFAAGDMCDHPPDASRPLCPQDMVQKIKKVNKKKLKKKNKVKAQSRKSKSSGIKKQH